MEERASILIAGDSDTVSAIEYNLTSLKHRVRTLNLPADIQSVIKDFQPDLILVAGVAGGIDRLELVNRFKVEKPHLPLIFVSRRDDGQLRRRALQAGADDLLTWPTDETELQVRIANNLKLTALQDSRLTYQGDVEEEVTRRTNELTLAFEKVKMASLDTVYRLSRAAEYRDDDVGTHIERMSHYATAIARAMNLDEEYIENILWAAPMHDVGKIGIPDHVLLKPGKLTDDEWTIMKQHTSIGSEILKDSTTDFIRMAGEIALNHHEKWDGSGYPRGLREEDIPLAGRIVAIADVFDALTSERPYKKAFTLDESFSIIKESIGSHFDPAVVKAFLSIEDEIVKEYKFWQFMSAESDPGDSETDLSDLFS